MPKIAETKVRYLVQKVELSKSLWYHHSAWKETLREQKRFIRNYKNLRKWGLKYKAEEISHKVEQNDR